MIAIAIYFQQRWLKAQSLYKTSLLENNENHYLNQARR